MGLRQMNGGSRSHGGDRTIIMQFFVTVLPFSFVTQDVKIVMVEHLGLVKCTYLHWTRRIWKHLSHTFCWWRYGLFSLLKFADLFCNGDGTISLPLMLKEKLSCAQWTVKYDPGSLKQMLSSKLCLLKAWELAWSPVQALHEQWLNQLLVWFFRCCWLFPILNGVKSTRVYTLLL